MQDNPLQRTLEEWEELFLNESHLRPIGHGDMSQMDREVEGWHMSQLSTIQRQTVYAVMVQAVLNRWVEIEVLVTSPYLTDPISKVASMAYQNAAGSDTKQFYTGLQESFARLWTDSPRPHTRSLRSLALNYRHDMPVSRAELGLLFCLPDWGMACVSMANGKGWVNDAIVMMQDILDHNVQMSVSAIAQLPELGYPITKALKWMRLMHPESNYASLVCERWEQQLRAQGVSLEQMYAHDD